MNYRQRRRLLVAAGTVVAGLLPVLLLIGLSYWQARADADSRRLEYADVALARAEKILDAASLTLKDAAAQIDPQCSAKTLAALAKVASDSLYVHSVGLIQNGALQCDGNGVFKLPLTLRTTEQLPAVGGALRVAAADTLLPDEPSIVVLYSPQPDLALAALVNPAQFGETLPPQLEEQKVSLSILNQDKSSLAQFGQRFDRRFDPAKNDSAHASGFQSIEIASKRFPIRVIVTTSQAWISQAWKHRAPLYASFGLAISGLLFVLGNKLVLQQFSLDAELRDALANGEFQIYYQPVIDLGSGACTGAEALLRWQHPQRGLVLPDEFFGIAEETGFVIPLTSWVLSRVAEEMGSLLEAHPNLHISLNLSARHILDASLMETIRTVFGNGLPPQRIMFEITEQQLLHGDHSALLQVVQQLRDSGARLALDDFGTGYSSLKYLTQFRFDYLKIDKVFVQAIGSDAVTAGLVDVIVDIAKRLRLGVIAEGVETTEQVDYLKRLDVQLVQGWLFSKALPAPLFRSYVNRRQTDLLARPQATKPT